jgi:geranyl diphosphate 2-C-methyltransferase
MTDTLDQQYWARVGQHYDRKGTDDINFLSSGDGLIVHHHTGLFPDGREPAVEGEEQLLRALWESEHRLSRLGAAMLQIRPGERGFDCGCGRGGTSFLFARDFGAEMFGITVSASQAEFASRASGELGLAARAQFALENLFDGQRPTAGYDFVWACESTEYMPDRGLMFAEWRRVLRPGGRALAIVLTYPQSRYATVEREMTLLNDYYVARAGSFESFLAAAMGAGFAVDDIVHLERETLPYWRLRLRSSKRTNTEPWLIHGLENGGFHFSAMLFRRD